MAYRLKVYETVPEGIKRIADEQIDQALSQLRGHGSHQGKAVHEARKRFKMIRALLRLVKGKLGRHTYQQENSCFRNAGRLLSEIRDAQVRLETLDKLVESTDSVPPDALATVRQALTQQYEAVRGHVNQQSPVEEVTPILKAARERVKEWPLTQDDWSALQDGLKQSYKRGYKNFTAAFDEPTIENFHEWRKAVKDLWYHLRILQAIWPDLLKEMIDQTGDLSDLLGDDHDLGVLHLFLEEQRGASGTEPEALVELIECRRAELQQSARLLGERIYAEKPSAFIKRIQAYWQAWRSKGSFEPVTSNC